jgi:hypothetical protein
MAEKTPHREARSGTAVVLLLCALTLLLHALTVRPGHTWWGIDDFTAYLSHGRNLVEGRPYGDIDSVHDPDLPASFQRSSFPPAFSLVVGLVDLSSSEGAMGAAARDRELLQPSGDPPVASSVLGDDPDRPYGLDLISIKRMLALFTALAVYMSYRAFRPSADRTVLLLAAGAFALSPYVFAFRELVRSEMLFLCLAYLWMAQVQWMDVRERDGGKTLGVAILAGVVMAAAYATRTAAVVLPPALIAADVWRHRRIRRSSWIVLGVGGACILAQRAAFASVEGGYVGKLASEWGFSTITENLAQLAWNYERLWSNGFSTGLQRGVAVFMLALAAVGFVSRLRRPTLSIVEAFTVLYTGMIIALPTDSAWMRYLLPVLPVFLLCVFTGARLLAGTQPARRVGLMGAAAVLAGISYAGAYANLDYGPLQDGLTAQETVEVFDWVARNTASDETIIFKKSRALTLATGRPSIAYPEIYKYGELSDAELWRHFEAVGSVAFILKHTPPEPSNMFRMLSHSDEAFLERFVRQYPEELVEVLRNDDFAVYEVRGFPHES